MTTAPLVGKQLDSYQLANARLNIYEGAVRSSKTVSSLIRWLRYVRTGPAGPLAMIGRTERTLKRNIIDPLIGMLGPRRCRLVEGAGELYIYGRLIYLAGANNELAKAKIQGLTLAGAYVDEVTTIPESMWRMLGTRLSVPGAKLFGTCNPESPNHWLYTDLQRASVWLDGAGRLHRMAGDDRLNLARFSFRLADNPTLDADYLRALELEYTGLWRRRYILGEWVVAEGSVYDMWDPERHVVPAGRIPHIRRWLASAVDYGTSNPFAALLLGLADDGRLYLVDEWGWDSAKERRQLTDAEYSRRYRAWLTQVPRPEELAGTAVQAVGVTPERHYVDPSAASFKVQLHHDGVTSLSDAVNDVVDGIRIVASQLASGRLLVSDRCKGWIDEAPGYVWDPKAQERGEDAPVKKRDHYLDAGRYGLASTEYLWMREPWKEVTGAAA
ncbi:terminase family protein [Parafrankia sp. FMc6]|uniref:PBSX family phage terminase large subunit n=1 Tax=Parafrankia soli TaxID=2599596 RepID=UPI0034D6D56F